MRAMVPAMLCAANGPTLAGIPDYMVMEPKLDGWRFQMHISGPAFEDVAPLIRGYAGRNGTKYDVPKHLQASLADVPADTILDGELIVPGGASTDVPNRLANGGRDLVYVAFDVLRLMGHDVTGKTWRQRRAMLDMIGDHCADGAFQIIEAVPVDQAVLDEWIAAGGEGAVVKSPDDVYRPGVRGWHKVKPTLTMDATVIGWKHGEGGGNKTQCGALAIRLADTGVETHCKYDCSPGDADAMVGRLIEIQHFGVLASGAVRHPTFLRTREDLETNDYGMTVTTTKKEKTMSTPREVQAGAWVRNYSAMGPDKLAKCIAELEAGEGDAVDRVRAKDGDLELNLQRARAAQGA